MTHERLRALIWWQMWQPRLDTWPPSDCGQALHDKIVHEAKRRIGVEVTSGGYSFVICRNVTVA